jgi:hypothetical protein
MKVLLNHKYSFLNETKKILQYLKFRSILSLKTTQHIDIQLYMIFFTSCIIKLLIVVLCINFRYGKQY